MTLFVLGPSDDGPELLVLPGCDGVHVGVHVGVWV